MKHLLNHVLHKNAYAKLHPKERNSFPRYGALYGHKRNTIMYMARLHKFRNKRVVTDSHYFNHRWINNK